MRGRPSAIDPNRKAGRPAGAFWPFAGASAALLHILTSWGNSVGSIEDDAVNILLSRSLLEGAYALPDASGIPVTDPLPGLAILLALPVGILDPAWGWLRIFELAAAGLAVLGTYRLAQGLVPEGAARAAAVMVALNPVLVSYAGLIMPDIPLMALFVWLVAKLPEAPTARGLALLAVGAAALALLKPHGTLLALALSLAAGHRFGAARGAGLAVGALTPLSAWLARNRLVGGTVTDYAQNWGSQGAWLAEPGAWLRHAWALLVALFSDGCLPLPWAPQAVRFAAALTVLALCGFGAWRLVKTRAEERAFALAAGAAAIVALHLTWIPVEPRYILPILPCLAILAAAGAEDLLKNRPGMARAALAGAALLCAAVDLRMAAWSLGRPRAFQPRTMAWLRGHVSPKARIQSLEYNAVTLLSGRRALPPSLKSRSAEDWLADAQDEKIDYLHLDARFQPAGFLPPDTRRVARSLEGWARSRPGPVVEEFRDSEEGTVLFRLSRNFPAGTPGGTLSKKP